MLECCKATALLDDQAVASRAATYDQMTRDTTHAQGMWAHFCIIITRVGAFIKSKGPLHLHTLQHYILRMAFSAEGVSTAT